MRYVDAMNAKKIAEARAVKRAARIQDNAALGGKVARKAPKKRKKKSLFVRLRDALDKEAQAYARERDAALGCRIRKAEKCTGRSELGYHLIPRGKWPVRWNLDFQGVGNIVGACAPCNQGENWHRMTYADHHREIFGAEFYAALWAKAHEQVKYTSTGMAAMLENIRGLRKDLGEGA